MVLFLIEWLEQLGWPLPTVFEYTSTRMVLGAATSLLFCILLGPAFIKKLYELKIGQVIRKEDCPLLGELHEKKQDTPTMGGILILASMLLTLVLWMDLTHSFTLILLLTTLVLGGVGACDDYLKLKYKNTRGLSPRGKMLAQGGFSLLLAAYLLVPAVQDSLHTGRWFEPPTAKEIQADGVKELSTSEYSARVYVPFVKAPVLYLGGALGIIGALAFVFVIMGSSNAVNLTDGLDGLAAGCLLLVAVSLAMVAFVSNHIDIAEYLRILYIDGAGEIAIYLSSFAGACLGFLWYNGYPAQVFMGDTGSLGLGGVLGVSAVLLKRELLLGILGGIFVVETLSVIIQVASFRLREGQRVFLCAPLHHHFEYKGLPETKVVIRFWIIGLLLALLGLASLKFQ